MIKLTDDGYQEFLTKWNSCVKKANRVDDKSQANHIVERTYIDRKDMFIEAQKEITEQFKSGKIALQGLKNLSMDDFLKESIERSGLKIELESSITIDGKKFKFTVPVEWLDFC